MRKGCHLLEPKIAFFATIIFLGIGNPLFSYEGRAQKIPNDSSFVRHSIFLEILGNGLVYSLNYDYKLFDRLSIRAGVMYLYGLGSAGVGKDISLTLVPILVNYLAGTGNHRVEIGTGVTAGYAGDRWDIVGEVPKGALVAYTATIGYRFQPQNEGFVFRFNITPILIAGEVLPSVGLSIGGTF